MEKEAYTCQLIKVGLVLILSKVWFKMCIQDIRVLELRGATILSLRERKRDRQRDRKKEWPRERQIERERERDREKSNSWPILFVKCSLMVKWYEYLLWFSIHNTLIISTYWSRGGLTVLYKLPFTSKRYQKHLKLLKTILFSFYRYFVSTFISSIGL